MTKEYDIVVYIGRFQPVHLGHVETLRRAARMANKVIVIVGSSFRPRSYKNPFSFDERQTMLRQAIKETNLEDQAFFRILPNVDSIYDDNAWMARIQRHVHENTGPLDKRIALIGHKKDASSEYIDWFPQWDKIDQPLVEPLDASQIRDLYFRENSNPRFIETVVSPKTMGFLEVFTKGEEFAQIVRERKFIDSNNRIYAGLPYAPTFNTADAIVTQAGHVLLIKRRAEPGKGLWAFPGGYINAKTDKTLEDAMIRELREETGLKLPEKVLRGSIKSVKTFDHVNRSERGRIITQAFHISLTDGEWNLPKVKGMDDAEKAQWVPLSQVVPNNMFEDHYDIFRFFIPGA